MTDVAPLPRVPMKGTLKFEFCNFTLNLLSLASWEFTQASVSTVEFSFGLEGTPSPHPRA